MPLSSPSEMLQSVRRQPNTKGQVGPFLCQRWSDQGVRNNMCRYEVDTCGDLRNVIL